MTRVSPSLRRRVRQRADGRCEYCRKPEAVEHIGHQADHIVPEKHTGKTTYDNLAWACFRCNNTKSDDIASYDEVTRLLTPLYNPRADRWDDHFELAATGHIHGTSPVGRVTVRILQLNRSRQVEIRRLLLEAGRL